MKKLFFCFLTTFAPIPLLAPLLAPRFFSENKDRNIYEFSSYQRATTTKICVT